MYAQLCSRLHTYNPKSDINKDKQNTVSVIAYTVCCVPVLCKYTHAYTMLPIITIVCLAVH